MIHVFRANDQPATRFAIDLGGTRLWTRFRRRTPLPCFKCKRRRWAANLVAHVYYDGTYFYCRPGKGCRRER